MNRIISSPEPQMQGPEVADLQAALQLLLDRGVILPDDAGVRRELSARLQRERVEQVYGDTTFELVRIFQEHNGFEPSGSVDEATAGAINALLREWGLLEEAQQERSLVVSGHVRRDDDLPNEGCLVRAFHESGRGGIRLGEDTTDAEGRYTIRYELLPGVAGINLRVEAYDRDGTRLVSSEVIREARSLEVVDLVTPVTSRPSEQRRFEGRVVLANGLPAERLTLRLYRLDFGGVETRLSETATRELGQYVLPFDLGGKAAGLKVCAVDASGDETVLSRPMHDLGDGARMIVNLVAPATLQPLAAEYQRLSSDLMPYVGEMRALAGARENDERQDLTVLNRATGWDARLVALAANAEKLSAGQDVQLPPDVVYGLLRAGLPSTRLQLAQVNAEVVEQALRMVREAGIVSLSDQQVAEAKTRFESFADRVRLTVPAPGSRSTYGDLLENARLHEDPLLNAEAQEKFASVYLNHRGGADRLWESARDAGLNDGQIQTLQMQGKLAFLAGNGEAMTTRLMDMRMTDPAQLADGDFYRADQWEAEVKAAAGVSPDVPTEQLSEADKRKLRVVVPPSYEDATVGDGLTAYAEDMARKVRLGYPTQTIGRMVEQDETDKFKLGDASARSATATLLKSAATLGFRLGETPLETFVEANPGVLEGIDDGETAKENVKTLQRVYQITPSDEAMPVLMELGLTSAYEVVALSEEAFVNGYLEAFQALYPDERSKLEAPRLVYRKAQQVSSVTYNLFAIASKLGSEPAPSSMSATDEVRESVKNDLIKQYPTMEALFGSTDFCECEHCRSVLSPAAYLVDLLQFVDTESVVWAEFLNAWMKSHDRQGYPHKDEDGEPMKPYDVLVERRPDIPHISLTCENTNTALPYIDVVNEILEFYVANEKLGEDAAHDTGGATTAELLAEPQNVIAGAYDKLRRARYPLGLPFDLWIETLRKFCDHFETPLWRLLETLRPGDDLFEPTQPYDRAAIFIESLGLSPAEYEMFTDPSPLENDRWYELYGYTTARPAVADPTNTSNATVSVADSWAAEFREGDRCAYFDVSADELRKESKSIRTVGTADSGGPGLTKIEFVGIWAVPPEVGDLLVLDAPAVLKSAKALSRRLGVTYKEIVEIVQTGFVNPKLPKLVILSKLGVTIRDVMFYGEHKAFYEQNKDLLGKKRDDLSATDKQRFDALKKQDEDQPNEVKPFEKRLHEVAAFEKRLDNLSAEYPSSGLDFGDWLNEELQNNSFDDVLVQADPEADCDFDQTTLRYANGDPADAIDFLRINQFARLWRKLGWTIEETDRALQAFVPESAPYETAHLDKQPLGTALIYLAHLKTLDEKLSVGKQGRLKLISLWSALSTTGKNPLYAQLFLKRSVLKSGEVFDDVAKKYLSVFDDPLGNYLSPAGLGKVADRVRHEVSQPNVKDADKIDPAAFTGQVRVNLRYDALREVQHLAYRGVLTNSDKAQLAGLSVSPVLAPLLDAVQTKAEEFKLVKGHLLPLQGALGLTADEIGPILTDAGKDLETAELSLDNVSLLYRYGLLAGALKLSVRELISLKQLSGLNPFEPLLPDSPIKLDGDHPFAQTLRFVEVAEQVKDSGLTLEDLEYLLRHRFHETGKYAPDSASTLALIKTLSEGVRAIRAEHAVPPDPGTMDEEVLRQKLSLVVPPEVAERFLAMMNGTVEFTATRTGVSTADKLRPKAFEDEASIREVSHSATRNEQKLTFRGVLFDDQKKSLKSRLPKPEGDAPFVSSPLLGKVLDDIQAQARSFFEKFFQKQATNVQPESGFLEAQDFDLLFSTTPAGMDERQQQARVRKQRTRLAQAFLPFLQQRLIRQFVVQTMTAQLGAEPALLEALLSDTRLLGDAQAAGPPQPLLAALTGVSEPGVHATFFNQSSKELAALHFADADSALTDDERKPLKPAGARSARFEGYLEVQAPGAYRFYVAFGKKGASAELRFDHLDHLPEPFLDVTADKAGAEIGGGPDRYLDLKPGVPYGFSLNAKKLNGGDVRLLVQGETVPKDPLAQLKLYPRSAVERADHVLLLLRKVLQLVQSLNLTEREVRYLLTHASHFDDLNLSKLPTRNAQVALEDIAREKKDADEDLTEEQAMSQARNENPELATEADQEADRAKALFGSFLRLAGYARLKRDLAGGTDDLVGIFETTSIDQVYTLIAKLTRREETTVKATARALFSEPGFKNELTLRRLWEALQVVERFGVPVASMLGWTRIVNRVATSENRFASARDLKEAIKARFEPEAWQRMAQPIFDKLRQRQRDALVSHVMHQNGFARMEQLYEYFLIDPGMEPVVQTSRIRLAISSLQLFVQRCLLNLEKDVHPSAIISARQWEWMKRYRVWEANRKIFLFPENWLEPEFRDDKTPLFSELEGSLLQGDVSNDLVEDAFLNYLKKLDELARLDIVAMHLEDDLDPAHRVLHVIGRTYSEPHRYFYRRYAQSTWTPWEPVTAEIEGDHLAPVVWRDRLYLFWVTFLEKPEQPVAEEPKQPSAATTTSDASEPKSQNKIAEATVSEVTRDVVALAGRRTIEAHLHWSEYLHGQWSTRESGGINTPSPIVITGQPGFSKDSVFIHVSREQPDENGGVYIHLGGAINQAFYLAGRNSTPEKRDYGEDGPKPKNPYAEGEDTARATRYAGSGPLKVAFTRRITTEDGKPPEESPETPNILDRGGSYTLLPCNNDIELGRPTKESLQTDDPEAVIEAIGRGLQDISSLMKPVFYQDREHTLFIEPDVEERTIEDWKEWAARTPQPENFLPFEDDWVLPAIPKLIEPVPIDPDDPIPFAPFDLGSLIKLKSDQDWLVNPATALLYEGEVIGPGGKAEMKVLTETELAGAIAEGGVPLNVHAGSELASGGTLIALEGAALERAGLARTASPLNVVGGSGFNSGLAQNFDALNRSGFGAGSTGGGLFGLQR